MIKQALAKFKLLGRRYAKYLRPVVVRARRLKARALPLISKHTRALKVRVAQRKRKFLSLPRKQQIILASTYGMISIGLLVVMVAFVLAHPAAPAGPEPVDMTGVITYSVDQPAENIPGDDYVWPGKPADPKYIRLPSLNVSGYIQKVAVDQNTQIAVPDNIFMAGWFINSVRPGAKGLSVIDGHLDGRSGYGIFGYLDKLKPGDKVEIELGNGTKLQYEVMTVNVYPRDKAANYIFSQSSKVPSQLNLVTCNGNFDQDQKSYDQRVVVTTKLLPAS